MSESKSLVVILTFFLLFCTSCDRSPGEKDILIKKINLEDKDFNIELYLDRSGGVYASERYQILKSYKDGSYYLLHSQKYRSNKLDIERYSNNEIIVYEE